MQNKEWKCKKRNMVQERDKVKRKIKKIKEKKKNMRKIKKITTINKKETEELNRK